MNRGVSFQIPNEYGQVLKNILVPLDCSQYDWLIGAGQVLQTVDGLFIEEDLFHEYDHILNGSELNKRINHVSYYPIFADLKGYSRMGLISDFDTYEKYQQSDCEIVVLITDSVYVSIYCKNRSLLESLYSNAMSNNYQSVTYITDENDRRMSMVAW